MALVLNEEQQLLKESAEGFFAERAPVAQLRQLRDDKSEKGYSPDLWQEMAEMGFAGVIADEEAGGTGFGYVGAGIVAEAMGTTLAASPFMASSVIALSVLNALEGDRSRAIAREVASGAEIATLAIDETSRHAPEKTILKVSETDTGYVLNGMKTFVPDAHVADKVLVLARTAGEIGDPNGLSLFIVESGAKGMIVDRTVMTDSRNWAKITFENVSVSSDNLLGEKGNGWKVLEPALDKVRLVIAAELLGVSQEAYRVTMEYLKERKQFDTIIGSFQALQHRAAHWYSELEVTRSAILKGLQVADTDQNSAWFASLAKAKASKTAELSTNEAIQMHGGIGMTDEYDIGFYIKRARVLQHLYGDFNYHSDRFAKLSGY
jgi:alkylation response protein AidB-like acyl-CoA dehydrogenase